MPNWNFEQKRENDGIDWNFGTFKISQHRALLRISTKFAKFCTFCSFQWKFRWFFCSVHKILCIWKREEMFNKFNWCTPRALSQWPVHACVHVCERSWDLTTFENNISFVSDFVLVSMGHRNLHFDQFGAKPTFLCTLALFLQWKKIVFWFSDRKELDK